VPGTAQNLFAPAIIVNDQVITGYELEQRRRMLEVLRSPGNLDELAREQLIDDRLRLQAAQDAGIRPSPEEILDGMEEFASRAGLDPRGIRRGAGPERRRRRDLPRFRARRPQLAAAGGAALCRTRLRVRGRGGPRAHRRRRRQQRARPAVGDHHAHDPGKRADRARPRSAHRRARLTGGLFGAGAALLRHRHAWQRRAPALARPERTAAAAAPHRAGAAAGARSPTRSRCRAPSRCSSCARSRKPPTNVPSRPRSNTPPTTWPAGAPPENLARAQDIAARADRCDDLYGIAQGQPEQVLERGALPVEEIPTDIAFELSKLDPGEISTALTRADGQTLVVLMLCGRSPQVEEEVDRDQITLGLRNQRLQSLSEGYLSQLRSDALISGQ
jgi:peptidyl-prolyl cis-trans isomerase SurA